MQTANAQRFFAAANTGGGFRDYFGQVFCGLSHLYIIKGGSGTGKSHLMRQIAREAQERGITVEYYHCSADPSSLDGILLCEPRIGVLDGTAPHTHDPVYPGVTDEIVNVGDFWDSGALLLQKEQITALIDKKKELYAQLYRYLGGACLMQDSIRAMLLPAVQQEKMRGAARRLLRHLPNGVGGGERLRITEAIGMDGPCAFDTLEAGAASVLSIRDRFDCADLFLECVREVAHQKELSLTLSPSPLAPARLRTLCVGDALCITAVEDSLLPKRPVPQKVINMDRFLDLERLREYRQRIRFCVRCKQSFLEEAYAIFAQIKKVHFALEDCYIRCMDFERKEVFTRELIARILPH